MATKLVFVCECGNMHKHKHVSTKFFEVLSDMEEYYQKDTFIVRENCKFRHFDTETVIAKQGNLVLVRDSLFS